MGACSMSVQKSIVASLLGLAVIAAVLTLHSAETQTEDAKFSLDSLFPGGDSDSGSGLDDDESLSPHLEDTSAVEDSSSSDDDDDDESDSDAAAFLNSDADEDDADEDGDSSDDNSLSDGDNVKVQYKLRLADTGKEVYRQWGSGDGGSFDFDLGGGHVIPGFDSAVSSMNVGETKTVTIPADQAYGSKGFEAMGIPADSDLEYTLK